MKKFQEVICINDRFAPEQMALIPNRPVEGKLYTIRDVFVTRRGRAVHLEEISNPFLDHPSGMGTFEPSFAMDRFRPIASTEESIEEKKVAYA